MLRTSENLRSDIGDSQIPMELLEYNQCRMVSKGERPEDFNRDQKERTESEISELRIEEETLNLFYEEVNKIFGNQENPN